MHTNSISKFKDTSQLLINRHMYAIDRHVNSSDMHQSPVFFKDVLDNDKLKANVPNNPDTEETPRQNPIL